MNEKPRPAGLGFSWRWPCSSTAPGCVGGHNTHAARKGRLIANARPPALGITCGQVQRIGGNLWAKKASYKKKPRGVQRRGDLIFFL